MSLLAQNMRRAACVWTSFAEAAVAARERRHSTRFRGSARLVRGRGGSMIAGVACARRAAG